jgi:hypothetical protein
MLRPEEEIQQMAISSAERTGRLEERVNKLEEGVSNFRAFQVEAREFFTENRTQRKSEMEFHNTRDQQIKDALGHSNMYIKRWMMLIAALACVASIVDIVIHYRVL